MICRNIHRLKLFQEIPSASNIPQRSKEFIHGDFGEVKRQVSWRVTAWNNAETFSWVSKSLNEVLIMTAWAWCNTVGVFFNPISSWQFTKWAVSIIHGQRNILSINAFDRTELRVAWDRSHWLRSLDCRSFTERKLPRIYCLSGHSSEEIRGDAGRKIQESAVTNLSHLNSAERFPKTKQQD